MSDARMPEDTPTGIADVLAHYAADCPALHGAVVATHDGLVLGATPSFEGDTPAAAAASLSVHQVHECLLWADVGVWYMCRLANGHVLLAHAADGTLAGALRLAGQIAAAQLAPLLPQDA
jgi:predicted regulator of Ras-like GTPase activity (Roadblock/LC7/MglB family)